MPLTYATRVRVPDSEVFFCERSSFCYNLKKMYHHLPTGKLKTPQFAIARIRANDIPLSPQDINICLWSISDVFMENEKLFTYHLFRFLEFQHLQHDFT